MASTEDVSVLAEELQHYIDACDISGMKKLLLKHRSKVKDIYSHPVNGLNAMQNAALSLHLHSAMAIQVLCDFNADVNATSPLCRSTPLHLASQWIASENAGCLVLNEADVNAKDSEGQTPLHIACNTSNSITDTIGLLIRSGADVNEVDNDRQTPMHIACQGGQTITMRTLLENNVNVNAQNVVGETPLHECVRSGKTGVPLLLQKGANINARDNYGNTPLHVACFHGQTSTVPILVEMGAAVNALNHHGQTPLDVSIQQGHIKPAELLLKYSSDVNIPDHLGNTLLHKISSRAYMNYSFDDSTASPYMGLLEKIIKGGADINIRNDSGDTPLHVALKNNHMGFAVFLVTSGANVRLRDAEGNSPAYFLHRFKQIKEKTHRPNRTTRKETSI